MKFHFHIVYVVMLLTLVHHLTCCDIYLKTVFIIVDFIGGCSDAGRCPADCSRPQWQCVWTRWGEGHRETAEKFSLLHTAGITTQQLWHGYWRWKGTSWEYCFFFAVIFFANIHSVVTLLCTHFQCNINQFTSSKTSYTFIPMWSCVLARVVMELALICLWLCIKSDTF